MPSKPECLSDHELPDTQESPVEKVLARFSEVGLQIWDPSGVNERQDEWVVGGAKEIESVFEMIDGKETCIGWSPVKGPTFGIFFEDGLYHPHIDDMSTPHDVWIVPEKPYSSLEEAAEFIFQNFNRS